MLDIIQPYFSLKGYDRAISDREKAEMVLDLFEDAGLILPSSGGIRECYDGEGEFIGGPTSEWGPEDGP